jgi:hypothetical protein
MPPTMRLLVVTLLGLAACAHRPSTAPSSKAAAVAEYVALRVGNEWTFADESPGLPPGGPAAAHTVRIVRQTKDGFFEDSARGEMRVAGGCVQDRLRSLLCGPLAVGTSWKSVVSASSTEKYEIVAVDETVSVPAGRFDRCVRVRAVNPGPRGTELVNEITYAPGVGPIRIETLALVNGAAAPQLRAVLSSYHVEGR